MSDNRIRWSMSLRQRDGRIAKHFQNVADGDRSAECRRLMYLGLDLLDMIAKGTISLSELPSQVMMQPEMFPRVVEPPRERKNIRSVPVQQTLELEDRLDKLI